MNADKQAVATPRTRAARHNMGSLAEPHYVVDVEVAEEIERELAAAQEALKKADVRNESLFASNLMIREQQKEDFKRAELAEQKAASAKNEGWNEAIEAAAIICITFQDFRGSFIAAIDRLADAIRALRRAE